MIAAGSLFSTLGRKQKLALAQRDSHAVRIHLDNLDHAVRADVLSRCDKYARDNARRGGGGK